MARVDKEILIHEMRNAIGGSSAKAERTLRHMAHSYFSARPPHRLRRKKSRFSSSRVSLKSHRRYAHSKTR